jgi:glycosyltransferase involved in cell wall biosynthesis
MPWLISQIREQKRRGHEVIALISGSNGTVAPQLEAIGAPYLVHPIQLPAGASIVAAGWTVLGLARQLRALRADVVEYHLLPAYVMGRLAGWLADVPLRYSLIPGTYYLEAPILSDLEVGTAWADTRVIATCEKTRELYAARNVPREKIEVIYYGLNVEAWDPAQASGDAFRKELGIAAGAPLVGKVAYFYPPIRTPYLAPPHLLNRGVKGHHTLFRAIPRVLRDFPDAKFVLVGKGWTAGGDQHMEEMRQLVRDSGLDHCVIFAGERHDVADVLCGLDVALQCSLSENLGGTIEALTMARPLVVSRVGGMVDTVLHEKTGLLFTADDDEELADAIVRLLRDRELAARLGAAGRAFMLERFTASRSADDLDELFARCIAEENLGERPRARRYRWWMSVWRLPQVPFYVAPIVFTITGARLRDLTYARLAGAIRRRLGRIYRRLTAAFAS